jgi:asparagine synthase (glutamine-hydrolysing)
MCGIAGAVDWGDHETLVRMTQALLHRGPDDWGTYETVTSTGTRIGLGVRRLSIVDLSPAGHMPMANPEGTIRIVYNGEIYNYEALRNGLESKGYRFKSTSDTEAVLYAYDHYGPDCVTRLDGMFAFAIWDARHERLFLARDHFGIKPLYYTVSDGRFAFASEIKALLQLPGLAPSVDRMALDQYLTFLWVPDPASMFAGIRKLPAGHYAIYQHGRLRTTRYWDLTFPPADHHFERSELSLKAELRMRLEDSVTSQLRSDVPLGAFLSAGLDSSTIVAAMSRSLNAPVRTYTIAFPPKSRLGVATLDDPQVAAQTARHFRCEHTEIMVEPSVTSLLPKLIWHMDEPVADPALIMAYLVSRAARETVTVLLSGVGGDELLAGYRKHYANYWANIYRTLPAAVRALIIEPALKQLPTLRGTRAQGFVRLLKKMARSASMSPADAFLMNSTYFDAEHRARLYTADSAASVRGTDPWQQHRVHLAAVKDADFLNQMLYLDMKTFMVSLNLNYNDKMSMASSVEVRVPFLSRELAEWIAWHVPPAMTLHGRWRPTTKYLLRTAMRHILPPAVIAQRKAGFGAPTDYWLTHDLREMVLDLLAEDRIRRRGFFDPAQVRRLLEQHYSGGEDWSLQIWQLLTFELWLQTFVDHQRDVSGSAMPLALPAAG